MSASAQDAERNIEQRKQKVERKLEQLKQELFNELSHGFAGPVRDTLSRLDTVMLHLKEPPERPHRNKVNELEYAKYKSADTVIVRTFEVGACVNCDRLGAVGHCCDFCSGDILSHLSKKTVPKNLVRLVDDHFEQEEEQAGSSPVAKKRKRSSQWSPESLEDLAKTMMFANASEWAGGQEDYVDGSVRELFEELGVEQDDRLERHLNKLFRKTFTQWSSLVGKTFQEYIDNRENISVDRVVTLTDAWKQRKKKKKKRKSK